ncbi:MAG: glycoside hydrolase family 25 protein [Ruminococcus sp.]|nr:glycoside hydrolase family 25 protein [Ruminococcus sp.]
MTSGIDVSQWQGNIDWSKAKASIDFALIRAGYGDTLSYPRQIDTQYERNYAECKRLGIPVGVYFYCYAMNEAEARREAECCLALLKGKQLEYPVYYDVEEYDLFKSGKTAEVCRAFVKVLEDAGYWVGIYTYRSAMGYFPSDIKDKKAMAIAEYGAKLNYNGQYGIWQNSSTSYVNGINGRVDHDYCYVDYPKLIKERGKNGYPKPAPKLMYQVTKDTPIVQFEGTEPAGKTVQVLGRKTICGVQYGRVTKDGWISLKDAKQI